MSQMLLKYYDYQNDKNYNRENNTRSLVLVLFYGGVNVADVCFEFSKAPVKPSDDTRDGCNVYAQLSFQAAGTPITSAIQAIYLALQTVDCTSYESILKQYAERGITDGPNMSNGYLVVDPALYASR